MLTDIIPPPLAGTRQAERSRAREGGVGRHGAEANPVRFERPGIAIKRLDIAIKRWTPAESVI
jgi:hypothetical protein